MSKAGTVKDKSWGSLGGNNPMHSWSGTGTQEAGQSAQEGSGPKRGIAPHAGASNVAFVSDNSKHGRENSAKHGTNADYAGTATPGGSGPTKHGGDKNGFAKGGDTKMFGNRGSMRAVGGQTCP